MALVAAAHSTDWLARAGVIGALVLGVANFVWQAIKAWRSRHRVEVIFHTAASATAGPAGEIVNTPIAIVTVQKFGRPMTLERIMLEWAGDQPFTGQYGFYFAPRSVRNPGPNIDPLALAEEAAQFLPFPRSMADGDSKDFRFGIQIVPPDDWAGGDFLPFTATAYFSNNRKSTSNVKLIPRPGWAPPST
jgi:hypothetical protein